MFTVRRSEDRGYFDFGWLKTFHTFSFGDYMDPDHMSFRSLRVINEDRVDPGEGFGTHPHRDMEIVTYVLEGRLAHRDSMGNGSIIVPGDVQRMSAGTGVTHSEFNASDKEHVHLLQIWILPNQSSLPPSYEQIHVLSEEKENFLRVIAAPRGGTRTEEGKSVEIHADARISACLLTRNDPLRFLTNPGRYYWVQVISGELMVNQEHLKTGDGVAIVDEELLNFMRIPTDESHDLMTHFLLFDLA